MNTIILSQETAKALLGGGWNLGDVRITSGVMNAVEEGKLGVEQLLVRHFAGDYGVINSDPIDLRRTSCARLENRSFTSLYIQGAYCIKVVTHPSLDQTVVCLARED